LYGNFKLRRVYYSAFSPIPDSPSVPLAAPPLMREHRLYQADFLLRSYGFRANELFEGPGHLALDIDPKLAWALASRGVPPGPEPRRTDPDRAHPRHRPAHHPAPGGPAPRTQDPLRRPGAHALCAGKGQAVHHHQRLPPATGESTSVLLREQLRDRPQPQQMGLWG
jgi:hypothetical protein